MKLFQQREKFTQRVILLTGQRDVDLAIAATKNAPIDSVRPLEWMLREQPKTRKLDQNALMWVGPLADIAAQAWYGKPARQFSAEVWHSTYKRLYLPEEVDQELCLEGYVKWDYDRDGERVLVGSTKQLTKKGFAQYLEQVLADGAGMGVRFSANPRERQAA